MTYLLFSPIGGSGKGKEVMYLGTIRDCVRLAEDFKLLRIDLDLFVLAAHCS